MRQLGVFHEPQSVLGQISILANSSRHNCACCREEAPAQVTRLSARKVGIGLSKKLTHFSWNAANACSHSLGSPTMRCLSLVLLVGMASAQHCRKMDIDKSSGFCTVPDPALTPGEMDPSLACVSKMTALAASRRSRRMQSCGGPTDTRRIQISPRANSIPQSRSKGKHQLLLL